MSNIYNIYLAHEMYYESSIFGTHVYCILHILNILFRFENNLSTLVDLSLLSKDIVLKLDLCDKKVTNKLKIRILSETTIPYLIRHASLILIVGLHL